MNWVEHGVARGILRVFINVLDENVFLAIFGFFILAFFGNF
jgi:hypothetical protein